MANLLPTPAWVILTTISGIGSLILFGVSHDLKSKIILGTSIIALIVHIISFICIWYSLNCIECCNIIINNEYVQQCVKSEIRTYIQNLPKSVIYDILNENKN